MKEEDLWIGDRILLIKSNRIGFYEGKTLTEKFKINVNGKIILTSLSNLSILKEEKIKKSIDFPSVPSKPDKVLGNRTFKDFNPIIDLHIEKLAPELIKEVPQMIVRHQLNACKLHVEEAIKIGIKTLTIIHGRGKGELRKEVEHLLTNYSEIHFTTLKHNGGATEVWLR